MTLEELQEEHIKLQEQHKQTMEELNSFKDNYQKSIDEKNSLSEEIQKLKNVNYELFERVNTIYKKQEDTVLPISDEETETETKNTTIDDIVNAFI